MQHSLSEISSMLVTHMHMHMHMHMHSHPCCSVWSLSSLLVIAIIIRTWKERNKCCHCRGETLISAFAFVTYNHRVYERVTMALSDWMALRKGGVGGIWHSAAQDGPPASPTFAPSSRRCHPRLATLGGSLPCWLFLLSRWILWCLWPIYRNRTWKNT